jgi:hypothetical protein
MVKLEQEPADWPFACSSSKQHAIIFHAEKAGQGDQRTYGTRNIVEEEFGGYEMKKLVALVAILAMAIPAMAATTVTCAQTGSSSTGATFTVSYSYDGSGSFPRAFALDISTNVGSITAVTATKIGESVSGSTGFGIFPGTIVISTAGVVTDNGTPVAPQSDLPSGTQAGLGSAAVTVELGSLYASTAVKPANSGTILTIAITCATSSAARTATITVGPNVARGGLVLEDATTATVSSSCSLTVPAAVAPDCFASSLSTYARWVSSGKPACWCPPASVTGLAVGGTGYQCVGDAASDKYPGLNYRVYSTDLTAVSNNWKKVLGATGYNACADVDHAAYPGLNYGTYSGDLTRVSTFWKKTDAQLNVTLGVGGTGGYCGQATVPAAYK